MNEHTAFGVLFLFLCTLLVTSPSITGAAIGATTNNTSLLFSLPFIALGAAIIAGALREVFTKD